LFKNFSVITGKLTLVSIFLSLASCGGDDSSEKAPTKRLIRQQDGFRVPAEFHLEDPECLERSDNLTIKTTTIQKWEGESVVPNNIKNANINIAGSTIKSDAIKSTTYLDTWIRTCDGDAPENERCLDSHGKNKNWIYSKGESKGPIRVCKNDHEYKRNSYESMTLASVYYTNSAHTRFAELSGDTKIPKINLAIAPNFIDDYVFQYPNEEVHQREYITHNLAYFQKTNSNPIPTIAVFPEDADFAKYGKGYFWDSLFALGHEYGHHIDLSSNEEFYSTLGLKWNSLTHSFDEKTISMVAGGTPNKAIQSGMQEAFADLLAFYAAEGDSSSFSGIPCLGENRNILSGVFSNNDEKMMTDDRFDILLGRAADESVGCDPHYNDQHMLGAIIAYTANQFFERLISENNDIAGSKDDFDQRYKLTLNWMKHFRAETATLTLVEKHSDRFRPISRAFVKTTQDWIKGFPITGDNTADLLETELCEIFAEGLPVSPELPWFEGSDSCKSSE
jgi:hypothetical protein